MKYLDIIENNIASGVLYKCIKAEYWEGYILVYFCLVLSQSS